MKPLRASGKNFRISEFDPDDTSLFEGGKKEASIEALKTQERLSDLQELLYAVGNHKLLIVLQGMDTSGKDGTIRHLMGGLGAVGVYVASFKKPSQQELDHDFLWRVHAKVPGRGEIVIFNRSHYEDVLVVRVRSLVPEKIWRKRYQQIVDFERMLVENGTIILKFFLYISPEEQKKRLEERVADATKRWKFNPGDLEERKLWPAYEKAYEDALGETSTDVAPWYVVPANKKWYRNWVIGSIVVKALEDLDMKYPEIDLSNVVIE
ncbi:MAG TPA: PPK2 family polyphosphate kinase [Thermoanaerobaculia bacterium]|nr:PPK2 family polyphosphate kinase [Thermoanaerobaculia bacterium]